MNNPFKKTALALIVLFSVFGIFSSITQDRTYAAVGPGLAEEYVPLAPLPERFFEGAGDRYDLPHYLQGMFKFLIALAGLLSVVMIVIGGIQYMSTDAVEGKSDGKEKIWNAVFGLLLALVSWLILYSINPKLLEFNLDGVTSVRETPISNLASKTHTIL